MISLVLYQPDIPQNVGAAMRLTTCLGCQLEIVEPCGFPWDERRIKQSAMDYYEPSRILKHASWNTFKLQNTGRIVLMTTKAAIPYVSFAFQPGDRLVAGRESAGVPDDVHNAADARLVIPMQDGQRSLNVVNAAAMVLGEALRQLNHFPAG